MTPMLPSAATRASTYIPVLRTPQVLPPTRIRLGQTSWVLPAPLPSPSLTANAQVTDPTDDNFGAGAGPNFRGHRDAARNFRQSAGVCEGRPGIIESTHIAPLNDTPSNGAWPCTPTFLISRRG